jgi:ABC-2 type transport system ATP-binding protein
MLSCLLRPTGGDARVCDHSIVADPQAVKESIGVVPQDIALYGDMSARENLHFWGVMYGLGGEELTRRVDEVLELITLTDRQKDRVEKFSGGMKRRVNIGAALLHKPQVLYLDEPTVGIDPQSRRAILDGILALREQGMTILYTTHYMAEAQELSDRIGIIDRGKLIALGTHDELVKLVGEKTEVHLGVDKHLHAVSEAWCELAGVSCADTDDESMQVTLLVADANAVLPAIFQAAETAGVRITSLNVVEPNLETVFLHLTGRALRE